MLNKIIRILFGTRAASIYIVLFAAAIGVATFIENDFGTSAAQKVVFQATWFELLLFLFCGSIVHNIIRFRMIPQKKWALLTFHVSIVIIIIGAGVTRFYGFEGTMHIREGESSNEFLSRESYIQINAFTENNDFAITRPIMVSSLGSNDFDENFLIENRELEVSLNSVVPNPVESLIESENGTGVIKVVVAGGGGRIEHFLQQGEAERIGSEIFNFSDEEIEGSHRIELRGDGLYFLPARTLSTMVMATQQQDTISPEDGFQPMKMRALHTDGQSNFVFPEWHENVEVTHVSSYKKIKNESLVGLNVDVSLEGVKKSVFLIGNIGIKGKPEFLTFDGMELMISYGSIDKKIPFELALKDFEMERYPGTNSAASYASDVVLIDREEGFQFDYRIFMNNILNYKGYRFFQTSFDKDERGTFLSVNHDFWGTWISYIGYALLTLGFIMTLFSKKSYFYQLSKKIQKIRSSTAVVLMLIGFSFLSMNSFAQETVEPELEIVSADHADRFSKLAVQDFRGRMKPMHTLNREVLRKISGRESFRDYNADQVILSMLTNASNWYAIPIIKVGEHTSEMLGVEGKRATYDDFFHENGSYKFRDEVAQVYETTPADRDAGDKELLKVDERLNILGMVFSGRIFRMIPVENDPDNTWVSGNAGGSNGTITVADQFFDSYLYSVHNAIHSGDYEEPNKLLVELDAYQKEVGAEVVPSEGKIKSEIFLNNMNVFGKLSFYYLILGMVYLFLLFFSVFNSKISLKRFVNVAFALVFLGFLFHTLGLGLRWYVSGRAPWSNGYESMIYIAWTTTLAGIIFTRKTMGGMAATMVLAATILLIAWLSYLDPEITPLVPVLKSYWLTIHVSLVAGSYGFLMLGAIMGLLNLIMMIFTTESNRGRLKKKILEMTYMSEMTLTGGLFMLSVGTYLGGVWANESWGRYWGWDAKETWALVTILVYAFILHMRLIPKFKSLFNYNLATLFGLSSVIMTYFGVNYYLSGLHSYAAGDPIPVPGWVYGLAISFVIISILAGRKRKLIEKKV